MAQPEAVVKNTKEYRLCATLAAVIMRRVQLEETKRTNAEVLAEAKLQFNQLSEVAFAELSRIWYESGLSGHPEEIFHSDQEKPDLPCN